MKFESTKTVTLVAGSLLAIAAASCLALLLFTPSFRLTFYLLYSISVISSAACFRIGLTKHAFGIASFTTLAATIVCFLLCGLLVGPEQHSADPVGANAMTNLFELVMYPFKFVPLTVPAVACWILAAIYEKWHIALHITMGILLAGLTIINLNIALNIVLNPEVLDWFLGYGNQLAQANWLWSTE